MILAVSRRPFLLILRSRHLNIRAGRSGINYSYFLIDTLTSVPHVRVAARLCRITLSKLSNSYLIKS